MIQTRWHEDDLAGRLIEEMNRGGDHWDILCSPPKPSMTIRSVANRANGSGTTTTAMASFSVTKATQLPRNWSALYQQKPTPDTGDYFKAEWLKPYHDAPPHETMTIYGASDYAVTDDGGDYTVHVIVGVDPQSRIYLLDVWRQQTSPDRVDRGFL